MPSWALTWIAIAGFLAVVRFGRGVDTRQYVIVIVAGALAAVAAVATSQTLGFKAAGAWALPAIAWGECAYLALAGRGQRRRWRDAMRDPLVLAPPFAGRWIVAAGGPWARSNHHLAASDQRYAYDFLRADGESLGTSILAPIGGLVVSARDGMDDREPRRRVYDERERPFGNYVAIATDRGAVFLCHLARDSVRVRVGQTVRAGDEVGRCGNSGRTTIPHLHLHAQDRPEPAIAVAQGVPIAFGEGEGMRVLDAGDFLGTDVP